MRTTRINPDLSALNTRFDAYDSPRLWNVGFEIAEDNTILIYPAADSYPHDLGGDPAFPVCRCGPDLEQQPSSVTLVIHKDHDGWRTAECWLGDHDAACVRCQVRCECGCHQSEPA